MLILILVLSAGVTARGGDDSGEKAPKPAKRAARSVKEAPKTPDEVLTAAGLTRSGANYILEDQEAECFKKFEDIRPLYDQLETSYNKVAAIAANEAQVAELQAEQLMTQQELQNVNAATNSMPRYGGRYARFNQNPNRQLQQQLQAQQTALSRQLATAKQQAVPPKQKQDTIALFEKNRSELLTSSTDIRALFEKAEKEYADIKAEPSVRTALGALRQSAKAQLTIAPTAKFNKELAQLKKLEKMLRPESTTGRSKSRRTAKSKR
jgi:hypothetical protein